MLKTKTWIGIISALLAVSILSAVLIFSERSDSLSVQILQNGKCIKEIDLNKVTHPFTFTVEDPDGGSNKILVEPGRIRMEEADCPDQICVKRGWLSDSAAPIVCLPHKLVIQPVSKNDLDTVAQ